MTVHLAGVLATFLGCLLLYLASPHQALRAAPLPAGPARLSAGLAAAAGLACLLARLHPVTAVLCWTTLAMLFLVALPGLGAQRQRAAARRDALR